MAATDPAAAREPRGRRARARAWHPFQLDAGGFDRHTFLCGQSGSGKTYSLGLVLEQLLLETDLRILVLDPNSDFVRLGRVREGADAGLAARYEGVAAEVAVRSAAGEPPLHLAFPELDPAAQAALLRLDPIADREEYAVLASALERWQPTLLSEFASSDSPDAHRRSPAAQNLGVLSWTIWSGGARGRSWRRSPTPACAASSSTWARSERGKSRLSSPTSVLARLWERRADRSPVLVVIDEAHNVCPAEPDGRADRARDGARGPHRRRGPQVRIYLLVSTQRPQKVHENVLSQCDNLLLMRMNSTADLGFVGDVFSFVPQSLLGRATTFRQGESLAAGKISPHPALLRFGGAGEPGGRRRRPRRLGGVPLARRA